MDDKIVGQTCAVIEKEYAHTQPEHTQTHKKYIYVYITIFSIRQKHKQSTSNKQSIKSSLETRPLRGIELIKAAGRAREKEKTAGSG